MSGETDAFVLPESWTFYQATLAYECGDIVIAAEPHGSVQDPTITLDVSKGEGAPIVLFLSVAEAAEIWTALGHAIHNASGADPVPAELIGDDDPEPKGDRE